MKTILLFAWIFISLIAFAGEPANPLPVCEVLHNLQKYNGKRIAVRGYWEGGQLGGDCKTPLKSGDYVWINYIYLKFYYIPKGEMVGISSISNEDELNKVEQKLRQLYPMPLLATVVGELKTITEPETIMDEDHLIPLGFGHLGVYPAEMLVREVKDVIGDPNGMKQMEVPSEE